MTESDPREIALRKIFYRLKEHALQGRLDSDVWYEICKADSAWERMNGPGDTERDRVLPDKPSVTSGIAGD
jgi:hypothetical protein